MEIDQVLAARSALGLLSCVVSVAGILSVRRAVLLAGLVLGMGAVALALVASIDRGLTRLHAALAACRRDRASAICKPDDPRWRAPHQNDHAMFI